MSYNVKWTDKEGITDNAMGIESLSEALEIADTGNAIYGDVTTQIIDDRNGLVVWNSTDSPALQEYIELDHEQWQNLQHGHHQKSEKPSVYFDIDGTLGKWYPDRRGMSVEELLDPANHYFRNIEANDMMINLAQYLSEQGVDVCIMSASYKDMIRDKWEWVQEHLPFIPEENICFSPVGADKSEFVKGNADISILIDDYNKNLEQWQGIAIKALNGINSHQEKFEEIDFTAWEQKLHNARELSLEYDTPELLDKVAYDAFRDVKRAGDKIIDFLYNSEKSHEFQYQLLGRLQSDCEYYLGFGNKNPDKLWAKNEIAQIEKMLEIYNALPVKPEWLTREQIYDYSNKMDVPALATYETYKKEWIAEHIDDQTMANTEALYENDENAVNLTFDEYVQEYGFADGSCYASFAEFRENEYKTYELADKIEQFMFERGEYDYSPEEHISWVKNNDSREDVTKSIRKDIENNNVDALINYLDVEESVMSAEDELCDVAIELMDKLKEFTNVPADVSIKHIIEPYDDYGEEIPSIDVVFIKYKDSNDYVLTINDEEEAVIRAEDNSKLLEYAIAEHNQSVSALLNDETLSYHFFAQKTENDVKLNVYFQDNSGEPSNITVEVPLTKEENEKLLQNVREYDERISGKNPISFDVSEIYGTSGQFYLLDLSGDVAVEAVNRAVLDSLALKIEIDKYDNTYEMLTDNPYEFYGQKISENEAILRFALPEHEIDAKVELTQNEQEMFLKNFSTYDEKQNKSQHKPKKHENVERE